MGLFSPIMSIIFNYIFFYKLFQLCHISHSSNYIYFKWGWRTLLPGDFNICIFQSPLTRTFLCWDEIALSLWDEVSQRMGSEYEFILEQEQWKFEEDHLRHVYMQEGRTLLTARPGRPCSPLCPFKPGRPLGPLSPGSPLSPRTPCGPCKEKGTQRQFTFLWKWHFPTNIA